MATKPNGNFQDLKTVKKVIKNVKAMKTLNTQKERKRERDREREKERKRQKDKKEIKIYETKVVISLKKNT